MAGIVKMTGDSKSKQSSDEQIFNTFQTLREEQRQTVTKLAEIDMEGNELKVVISTLEKVDGARKCYRLIGGVLCEKTVKEVLPILVEKESDLAKLHVQTKDDLMKKGVEINEYKAKHNIRIQGQDDIPSPAGDKDSSSSASTGVLAKG